MIKTIQGQTWNEVILACQTDGEPFPNLNLGLFSISHDRTAFRDLRDRVPDPRPSQSVPFVTVPASE